MPRIAFVDTVSPSIMERLRANLPEGWELLASGPSLGEKFEAAANADYLMTWTGPIGAELLASARRVRMVQKTGQGVDNIDLEGARLRGVPICNAGATNTTSVAEHTILLMLAVCRRLPSIHSDVREAAWPKWKYRDVSREISEKRVGIVGLGNIGQKVAQRLQGWECELGYYDPATIPLTIQRRLNIRPMSLERLLGWCDILTLHVFLDSGSRHLIGAAELALMKPGSILVNASRGRVVDETALVEALRSGRLLGAGLDVFEQEPPDPRNPLLSLENVVLSSHIAGGTWDALERTIRWSMENLARFERGQQPLSIQNGL